MVLTITRSKDLKVEVTGPQRGNLEERKPGLILLLERNNARTHHHPVSRLDGTSLGEKIVCCQNGC